MGMFDYLKCEYPLLDKKAQNALFQTKDTNAQYMEKYILTREGRLIHHTVRYEPIPEEDRPCPNGEGMLKWIGSIRSVSTGYEDTGFHGSLCFYTDIDGERFEYIALLKDGSVIDLRRTPART
jgi:hypothetical protein